MWTTLRAYFPVTLVKTADLDPQRRYLFASHPHGVISVGVSTNFLANGSLFTDLYPGIDLRVHTLRVLFYVPLYREYLLAVGLCDASREALRYNLQRGPGAAALVVIGGAQEALDAHPGTNDLTLAKRKGFVRVRDAPQPGRIPARLGRSPGRPTRRWRRAPPRARTRTRLRWRREPPSCQCLRLARRTSTGK